ncbi:MAG: hypothetical protein LBE50_03850 [Gallionellaceae bacterium]|jgi:predicted DNA-binding protein|nr:hypothetical protein [Gallionellaceae bacterium]
MAALTVRLPDEKHQRLRALAKSRGTPLNRLIDEMATLMLAEFDAETRFAVRAVRGATPQRASRKLCAGITLRCVSAALYDCPNRISPENKKQCSGNLKNQPIANQRLIAFGVELALAALPPCAFLRVFAPSHESNRFLIPTRS